MTSKPQRASWEVFTRFSSSIVFAITLIEQVELSATAWQGNWAEITSAQVYMCEKTHLIVHLRCFSFA